MVRLLISTLFFCGLFYISEGKLCPERTRPHKTRCDAYYKCVKLSSKTHVWLPETCDQGLVYEQGMGICVLPEDDWECMLGDPSKAHQIALKGPTTIEPEIYIVSNEMEERVERNNEDDNVEVVHDDKMSSEDDGNMEQINNDDYEGSGNEKLGELVVLEGLLPAENREIVTDTTPTELPQIKSPTSKHTDNFTEAISNPKIDPNLTRYLQRLAQIIDGLKQSSQQTELRPDQLNAFLAHFNIKTSFDNLDTGNYQPTAISSTTTVRPKITETTARNPLQPTLNDTLLQDHLSHLKPEMKVMQGNGQRYGYVDYNGADIVVNRPEGSIKFSLAQHGNDPYSYRENHPRISEETLKRVLELSKQMIASQNVPKVIPNPTYYSQPILQPIILASTVATNPFSAYSTAHQHHQKAHQQQSIKGYKPYTHSEKPATTIIHNNVIPVQYTGTSAGENTMIDSYGHNGIYPPHVRYTTMRPQITSTTKVSTYAGASYPSVSTTFSPDISVTTMRPFEHHPTPSTIAEFYTPNSHLSDQNANSIFIASNSNNYVPTLPSFTKIPHPVYNPESIEIPQSTDQMHPFNVKSLFPPLIDPSKVKIRPNSQKIESMEDELEDATSYLNSGTTQTHTFSQLAQPHFYDDYANVNPPYLEQQAVTSVNSGYGSSNQIGFIPRPLTGSTNTPQYPAFINAQFPASGYSDGTQLVNFGGNFINFDIFKSTILPILGHTQALNNLNKVEIINCSPGVRQANTTDCTRYYVCSKRKSNEPSKVYAYSCPPYTAFNTQTRICDARTYELCRADELTHTYSISGNKQLHMEALKAMQNAKRHQEQVIKSQAMASLMQEYNQVTETNPLVPHQLDSNESHMLTSYIQQANALSVTSTTQRPEGNFSTLISGSNTTKAKKRKYYCKEGDKIADQTSINSYFVCYKNAQGMMKGHKMSCSKGLLFCPKTTMCTTPARCG